MYQMEEIVVVVEIQKIRLFFVIKGESQQQNTTQVFELDFALTYCIMVGQLQCCVSKNTKEKEIHSVQNSKCQRESCNVSKLLMYSKLAQSNMQVPSIYLGIQKKVFGIFYDVVFSFAWTKLNLKSFLLLWFCIPLLGLIALDVETFTS